MTTRPPTPLLAVARDHGDALVRALELTPFAREEFDLSYTLTEDPVEQARRTVVRSFMGFGSNTAKRTSTGAIQRTGFRANSNRSGTTPAHDWRTYPAKLRQLIERLQGVTIEHRDAQQVMAAHDCDEAVHYIDPPYVAASRDAGHDYRHELTDAGHERMAEQLRQLRGAVVLSGYASTLYDRLYADWQRVERHAYADGARPRIEVLWLSPRCPRGLFS